MNCGDIFLKRKESDELECLLKEYGNAWIMIAFDPVNKVVMSFVVGKRN